MDPNPASLYIPLETLTTLGFYFVIIIYIVFSAILHYHWKEYNIEKTVTKTTLTFYYSTTLPLVLILAILALII